MWDRSDSAAELQTSNEKIAKLSVTSGRGLDLGDDFSMLDVAIAPLLWRLDYYGIDLSKNALPLLKYAERIFSRPAYIEALTPSEKVMRK